MVSGFQQRIWITVLWHFALLFVVALACHGELALDRARRPAHLTAVLPPALRGRRPRRPVQRAARACRLHLARRVSARRWRWLPARRRAAAGPRPRPRARSSRTWLSRWRWPPLALVLFSDLVTLRLDTAFFTRLLQIPSATVGEWVIPAERTANKILVYGAAARGALPPAASARLTLGAGPRRRARRRRLRGRTERASDPPGAELLRRAARHARQRPRRATRSSATAPRSTAGRASIPSGAQEPLSYYHRGGPIGPLHGGASTGAAREPGGRDRPRDGHAWPPSRARATS